MILIILFYQTLTPWVCSHFFSDIGGFLVLILFSVLVEEFLLHFCNTGDRLPEKYLDRLVSWIVYSTDAPSKQLDSQNHYTRKEIDS